MNPFYRRKASAKLIGVVIAGLIGLLGLSANGADDLKSLCRDRLAVERVYYNHRIGTKPPFNETIPPGLIEELMRKDLQKEAILRSSYGVVITPAMIQAEVARIDATTRAPETLAELKSVLGNSPERFAETVAKPIVVERMLRSRFEDDGLLHIHEWKRVEGIRAALIREKVSQASLDKSLSLFRKMGANEVSDITWKLGSREEAPAESSTEELVEIQKRLGPSAQVVSSRKPARPEFYFEDLPADLRRVLAAQLHGPGDISAVIEMPSGFLLCIAKVKTSESLDVALLRVRKRSYEEWLAEQSARLNSKAGQISGEHHE